MGFGYFMGVMIFVVIVAVSIEVTENVIDRLSENN